MSKRVHVFMPDELLDRVDQALGSGQSRGEFVRRAVEQALVRAGGPGLSSSDSATSGVVERVPAPAEQPRAAVPVAAFRRAVPVRRDVKPFQRGGS